MDVSMVSSIYSRLFPKPKSRTRNCSPTKTIPNRHCNCSSSPPKRDPPSHRHPLRTKKKTFSNLIVGSPSPVRTQCRSSNSQRHIERRVESRSTVGTKSQSPLQKSPTIPYAPHSSNKLEKILFLEGKIKEKEERYRKYRLSYKSLLTKQTELESEATVHPSVLISPTKELLQDILSEISQLRCVTAKVETHLTMLEKEEVLRLK